jgi:hypothetical protein
MITPNTNQTRTTPNAQVLNRLMLAVGVVAELDRMELDVLGVSDGPQPVIAIRPPPSSQIQGTYAGWVQVDDETGRLLYFAEYMGCLLRWWRDLPLADIYAVLDPIGGKGDGHGRTV